MIARNPIVGGARTAEYSAGAVRSRLPHSSSHHRLSHVAHEGRFVAPHAPTTHTLTHGATPHSASVTVTPEGVVAPSSFTMGSALKSGASVVEAGVGLAGLGAFFGTFIKPLRTKVLDQTVAHVLPKVGLGKLTSKLSTTTRKAAFGQTLMDASFAATSLFGMVHAAETFSDKLEMLKSMCADVGGKPVSTSDVIFGNIPDSMQSQRKQLISELGVKEFFQAASLALSVLSLKGRNISSKWWIGSQLADVGASTLVASNKLLEMYGELKAKQAAGMQLTVGDYANFLDHTPLCESHASGASNDMILELAKRLHASQTPVSEVLTGAVKGGSLDKMIGRIAHEYETTHGHHHGHFTSKVMQQRNHSPALAGGFAARHAGSHASHADRLQNQAASTVPGASL